MKMIKAYIRPILLEEVYTALRREGFCCMTVFSGEGTGKYINPEKEHGSMNFPAMHAKIVKIEIAAHNDEVERIEEIIQKEAQTGAEGDGIIFISNINESVRIKDGKRGPEILV